MVEEDWPDWTSIDWSEVSDDKESWVEEDDVSDSWSPSDRKIVSAIVTQNLNAYFQKTFDSVWTVPEGLGPEAACALRWALCVCEVPTVGNMNALADWLAAHR